MTISLTQLRQHAVNKIKECLIAETGHGEFFITDKVADREAAAQWAIIADALRGMGA